jgi:hypothetical protein
VGEGIRQASVGRRYIEGLDWVVDVDRGGQGESPHRFGRVAWPAASALRAGVDKNACPCSCRRVPQPAGPLPLLLSFEGPAALFVSSRARGRARLPSFGFRFPGASVVLCSAMPALQCLPHVVHAKCGSEAARSRYLSLSRSARLSDTECPNACVNQNRVDLTSMSALRTSPYFHGSNTSKFD